MTIGKVTALSGGRCLRPALPMNRALLRGLGLSVGIAIAVSGCADEPEPRKAAYGILRVTLFQQCLATAKDLTPKIVSDRGSWSEVVEQCGSAAYYQANTCDDEQACLDAITASGTDARQRQDAERPDPKGDGPAPKADAQGGSHDNP